MMVIQWRALTHELPWRGFDTISENRRDIYKWYIVNRTILEMDVVSTSSNELGKYTYWRLGISIFFQILFTSPILSNVTERGHSKHSPPELLIYVRLGRSTTIIFNYSFLLRIINEQDESFLPWSAQVPRKMDSNNGRSTQIISFQFHCNFQLLLTWIYRIHEFLK